MLPDAQHTLQALPPASPPTPLPMPRKERSISTSPRHEYYLNDYASDFCCFFFLLNGLIWICAPVPCCGSSTSNSFSQHKFIMRCSRC
ncbi:hypothetical protein PVAP13_3KG284327 [Panicum virgatum]|uniref:Uncharacterized protein n=1 Tax=Panicum virgatum TaxID=38727 RepID=A0A8T0UV07_PANVG|nr:hypothetical protein PVAP13_3KG284327 [Panicum virgatum]